MDSSQNCAGDDKVRKAKEAKERCLETLEATSKSAKELVKSPLHYLTVLLSNIVGLLLLDLSSFAYFFPFSPERAKGAL